MVLMTYNKAGEKRELHARRAGSQSVLRQRPLKPFGTWKAVKQPIFAHLLEASPARRVGSQLSTSVANSDAPAGRSETWKILQIRMLGKHQREHSCYVTSVFAAGAPLWSVKVCKGR